MSSHIKAPHMALTYFFHPQKKLLSHQKLLIWRTPLRLSLGLTNLFKDVELKKFSSHCRFKKSTRPNIFVSSLIFEAH